MKEISTRWNKTRTQDQTKGRWASEP